jgi:citrate synthase
MTIALDRSELITACPSQTTTIDPRPAPCGQSAVLDGDVLARGVPIGRLAGAVSYVDMLFFQLQSRYPTQRESRMMEAYLVALCEHGVTSPSTHGARVAASVRAPFGACAINFISAAMGAYHFGALELAMQELAGIAGSGADPAAYIDERIARGERLWGFGHRFHKSAGATDLDARALERLQEATDPRVRRLLEIADEIGWDGPHLALVRRIGRLLYQRKRVPINVDGVAAGLLLDMGFDPRVAMLFVVLGRLPNIARLYMEEQEQPANRFVGLASREDPSFDRTVDRDLRGKAEVRRAL